GIRVLSYQGHDSGKRRSRKRCAPGRNEMRIRLLQVARHTCSARSLLADNIKGAADSSYASKKRDVRDVTRAIVRHARSVLPRRLAIQTASSTRPSNRTHEL